MDQQKTNARTSGARPGGTLRITWVKSAIGYAKDQKETIASLGLRRLNQTVERPDDETTRGMIFKVKHLIAVEEI